MKVKIEITLTNAENFPYIFKQLKIFGEVNIAIQGNWQDSKNETVFLSNFRQIESMGRNEFKVKVDSEPVLIPFRYRNLDKRCEIKLTVNEESGVN